MTRTGRFLLDTNIVSTLYANEATVQQRLTAAEEVFVPCIVLGELYYGTYRSARAVGNLARLNDFATSNTVLLCDTVTTRHYGDIKNALRAKGRPIPENDIWIAAVARQYDLIVVARDAHFHEVDGLPVEAW